MVAALLIDPSQKELPCVVIDNDDGSYSITYVARGRGKHELVVCAGDLCDPHRWQGLCNGFPMTVMVAPSADPASCFAAGPGVGSCTSGCRATFHLHCVTSKGTPAAVDPADLELTLGAVEQRVNFTVKSSDVVGDYRIEYRAPLNSGLMQINVKLRGIPVDGSPFSVTVLESTLDPTRSVLCGDGIELPRALFCTSFRLSTFDKHGNPLTSGGADVIAIVSADESRGWETLCDVTDNLDGTYDLMFAPDVGGMHRISVSINQVTVPQSPVLVKVAHPPSPKHSTPDGATVRSGIAGSEVSFLLHAVSSELSPARLPLNCGHVTVHFEKDQAEVAGRTQMTPMCRYSCTDREGVYLVTTYLPPKKGTWELSIKLFDEHIAESPFSFEVLSALFDLASTRYSTTYIIHLLPTSLRANVCADSPCGFCRVSGKGIQDARAFLPSSFQVCLSDRFGNRTAFPIPHEDGTSKIVPIEAYIRSRHGTELRTVEVFPAALGGSCSLFAVRRSGDARYMPAKTVGTTL
jgi:hypothetical protein